jgi:hypothetical protein
MKRKAKNRKTRLNSRLGLPDLENSKVAVIVSLRSFESQRSYRHSNLSPGIAPLHGCRSIMLWSSDIAFTSKIATSPQAPST